MYNNKDNIIPKEESKYLGASDIVNGAANTFQIKEEEMATALEEIMKEINEMS